MENKKEMKHLYLFLAICSCSRPPSKSFLQENRSTRLEELRADIKKEGLLAVSSRQNLSDYDKDILSLVADLVGDKEAQELLGSRGDPQKKYTIQGGNMTPEDKEKQKP